MRAVLATAHTADGCEESVLVMCFGHSSMPLSLADQERELRIQAEGLLLRAEMVCWELSGNFDAHAAAAQHQDRMFELIKGRSASAQAWLAEQRGLPNA